MAEGLWIEGEHWDLVGARFHVSKYGDWILEADTRGKERPDGVTYFILPGRIELQPSEAIPVPCKDLVFTPEDSGDMMPFIVDDECGSLTALAGGRLELVAVEDGLGTFVYEGPFEWVPDGGDVEERRVSLRVRATIRRDGDGT